MSLVEGRHQKTPRLINSPCSYRLIWAAAIAVTDSVNNKTASLAVTSNLLFMSGRLKKITLE